MFWFITETGKCLTNIYTSIPLVKWISAYTLQSIDTGLSIIESLKLGPTKSAFKYLFTHEKVPERINIFNSFYRKIRWTVIKVSKTLKPIVMSHKLSAALSALATATSLIALSNVGIPIILLGAGFSALATCLREDRQGKIKLRIKTLKKSSHKLQKQDLTTNSYTYLQPQTLDKKSLQQYSYIPPSTMEIIKMGLDFTLAGITCSISSWSFISTAVTYTYSIYSEVRNYLKIKSIRKKIDTLPVKGKQHAHSQHSQPSSKKWTERILNKSHKKTVRKAK